MHVVYSLRVMYYSGSGLFCYTCRPQIVICTCNVRVHYCSFKWPSSCTVIHAVRANFVFCNNYYIIQVKGNVHAGQSPNYMQVYSLQQGQLMRYSVLMQTCLQLDIALCMTISTKATVLIVIYSSYGYTQSITDTAKP